jgi:ABC-type molybdate transport system substrate-binding protein
MTGSASLAHRPAKVAPTAAGPLRLRAAGSLRVALTEIAAGFSASAGVAVDATFAAAGTLRARIEAGEAADLFASADLGHPRRLAEAGLAGPVRPFARTELCALAAPRVAATPDTLLDAMLSQAVRLGVSTPGADPAGDYALALFGRAGVLRPGAGEALAAKALRLTGAPDSPKPADGRNLYAWVLSSGQADVFLTYRTNAELAVAEAPALRIVALPPPLASPVVYGLAVLRGAHPAAERLARRILSPAGRTALRRHGFRGVSPWTEV